MVVPAGRNHNRTSAFAEATADKARRLKIRGGSRHAAKTLPPFPRRFVTALLRIGVEPIQNGAIRGNFDLTQSEIHVYLA